MASWDLSVLYLAVPALSVDLQPTATQLLWIVDIYGFVLAGLVITMGTLGDRLGRRRLLLVGAAGYAVAAILASFATTPYHLIAARALLGIAGATLATATLSLIRLIFDDARDRSLAVGIWGASFAGGRLAGSVLGGALLERFWWGSIFIPGALAMVVLLTAGPRLLPEVRAASPGRVDAMSVVLSLTAMLSVVYGVKRLAEHGWSGTSLMAIVVGVTAGTRFVRRQSALAQPLVDMSIIRRRGIAPALLVQTTAFLFLLAALLLIAQYLQLVSGLSPFDAGLWTVPSAAGMALGALVSPVLARRFRPALVMVGGLITMSAGFLILAAIGSSSLGQVVLASLLITVGLAPLAILTTDFVIGSVPAGEAGAAAAITETSSDLGNAVGVGLLGSLGAVVYRRRLAGTLPDGLAPEVTAAAERTLGDALEVAGQLDEASGQLVATAAQDAFLRQVHVVGLTSLALAVAAAAYSWITLRHLLPGGSSRLPTPSIPGLQRAGSPPDPARGR